MGRILHDESMDENNNINEDNNNINDGDFSDDSMSIEDTVSDDTVSQDTVSDVDATDHDEMPSMGEFGEGATSESPPTYEPPTAEPGYVAAEDRLVRDPDATFGGVASGVAHRFGWDVALTRVAVAATFLLSGGMTVLLYLAAWIAIPRATSWPPLRSHRPFGLSSRDLAAVVLMAAALIIAASAGGQVGAVVVPLVLIGGGLWLLTQSSAGAALVGGPAPATPAVDADQWTSPPASAAAMPAPPVAPALAPAVEPRSRKRRGVKFALILLAIPFLLLLVAIPALIVAAFAFGDVDFDSTTVVRPAVIEELPTRISEDGGELTIDLRNLDGDDFTEVRNLRASVDFGKITVLVPSSLDVNVDAEVDAGNIVVFGEESDGVSVSRNFDSEDPDIDLDLDVNLGEIVVKRED